MPRRSLGAWPWFLGIPLVWALTAAGVWFFYPTDDGKERTLLTMFVLLLPPLYYATPILMVLMFFWGVICAVDRFIESRGWASPRVRYPRE